MRWGTQILTPPPWPFECEDYSLNFINFVYMVLNTHAMHESENKRLKQINCHSTTQNNVQINAQSKVFVKDPTKQFLVS
jgi:hypothetical protein